MSDNESVQNMKEELVFVVNKYNLPMSVKILALENLLLKANSALEKEMSLENDKSRTEKEIQKQ